MKSRTSFLARAALIAAVYLVLTHLQNFIPGGLTWGMIQFRVSEALCVLALFTPSAIPGLTLGCLLFNLTSGAALPLDFLIGSAATLIAAVAMYLTKNVTVKAYPLVPFLFPVLTNAVLVGWELSVYIGGGFIINAMWVALGEAAVMFILGSILYCSIKAKKLDAKMFK